MGFLCFFLLAPLSVLISAIGLRLSYSVVHRLMPMAQPVSQDLHHDSGYVPEYAPVEHDPDNPFSAPASGGLVQEATVPGQLAFGRAAVVSLVAGAAFTVVWIVAATVAFGAALDEILIVAMPVLSFVVFPPIYAGMLQLSLGRSALIWLFQLIFMTVFSVAAFAALFAVCTVIFQLG